MEAEIERLYQLYDSLNQRVESLIASQKESNTIIQDLEIKIEDIRRAIAGAYEL